MATPEEVYSDPLERRRAAQRKYYWTHKEAKNAKWREYYTANREVLIAKKRARYSSNPEPEREKSKQYRIKNRDAILARQREYNKRYAAANRKSLNEKAREYRESNKETIKQRRKEWVKSNFERNKSTMRKCALKRDYRLTPEEWNALLEKQNKLCPICGTAEPGGRGWHVDHDHSTGVVRGILCARCNIMLGHARDRREILLAAIEYLANPPATQELSLLCSKDHGAPVPSLET